MFGSAVAGWWNELFTFQQVLFIIACTTTLFLLVQIILMMIGGFGDDASFDADTSFDDVDIFNNEGLADFASLKLVSLRTIIAFLCIGSWVAFIMQFWLDWYWAVIIGVAAGALTAVAVAYLIQAMMKLQAEGNIHLENAIGKVADVYLTIPGKREGSGKINVTVQDSLIEREAVTDHEFPIKTGEKVKIVQVLSQSLVVVEKLDTP